MHSMKNDYETQKKKRNEIRCYEVITCVLKDEFPSQYDIRKRKKIHYGLMFQKSMLLNINNGSIKEERKLNNNKKETTFIQETTLCVFIVEYLVYN